MEQEDLDQEMEVDAAGTFCEGEGEMKFGEESHQIQKEHNQNINDDSRGRSKNNNSYVDEYLSNTFMKLSVTDGLSVSPAECDNNRQRNSIADGNHRKFTNSDFNSSPNHDKNLKVLKSEPNGIMSENFKTRSSVIDGNVNVPTNDVNKMSLPYNTSTVDSKEQKQVMINNSIDISGAKSHHNKTNLSLPLKVTIDIRNSFFRDLSSPLKEVEYGTNNGKQDLISPQKQMGNGVSSLQSHTSLALTGKVQGDNNFCYSLQNDTSSPLAGNAHGMSCLQSSKFLVPGKRVNNVKSLHNNSVSTWKEIGYDGNSLREETLLAMDKKDHGVNCLKNNSSSTLKEKEHCARRSCASLCPTLKEKGHADLSSTKKEKGHVGDSGYADSSLTLKERRLHREVMKQEKTQNIIVELHENDIKHEKPYHCEEKYPHRNDDKLLQKQKNGKADDRNVYKTDFSNINRPCEDKSEGFNICDTSEHARFDHRKRYQTREDTIYNNSRKIGNQGKSKRENGWEISMSHSNNVFDKRHEIKSIDRESYHQRRKDIHAGITQQSGNESSDNDTDESLHVEDNRDKFASIQNAAIIDIVYRKHSWNSYLEINQHIGKWDYDCLDPFEQSLSRCTFGSQKKKKFYRDFEAHSHHESGEIRGWNKGEFVFIGELCPGTNERVKVIPESSFEKGEGDLTPEGGAIRKTNEKNADMKRGEQGNLQRRKVNAESNMEYGSFTESQKRLIYGLPPELFTEDETDSSDESKDESAAINGNLHHQSQSQRYCSVLTRESPEITDETKSGDSCYVPSSSLVKYLTRCEYFSSDMTRILSRFSLYENVKEFFEENPGVFSIRGNIVELRPKISLCEDFLSLYGCQSKSSCTKLHICDGFIVNICNDSNCIYGHNICTTHNKKALRSFWMENLDASTIVEVIRLSMLGAANFQSLDICYDYNFSSCQNYDCKALHICLDYVGGLGSCIRPDCTLNHDIQAQNCIKLLSSYGIDIALLSEEEKLLKVIQESHEMTQLVQGYESKGQTNLDFQLCSQQQQSSSYSKVGPKQGHELNGVKSSEPLQTDRNLLKPAETIRKPGASKDLKPVHSATNASSVLTLSQNNYSRGFSINGKLKARAEGENESKNFLSELPVKIKNTLANISLTKDKVNSKNQKNGTKVSTVWSKYAKGDLDIAEICYYALNTVCKFESSGCQRLHATLEFHWQMKVSDNVSWINLQPHQVVYLEQCYMDPSIETSEFPAPRSAEQPQIVHQLLKDGKHYVNFTKLQLINATTFDIYELRRLHVQAKYKNDSFNEFLWYFKDVAGKWVLYGNIDSSGDHHSAAKIRSHDIEKTYLNNMAEFNFKNSSGKSSYILDFKKMVQVNRDTKSVREVRRRPKPLIPPKS
ncbi:uncharacterized protein [Palaemon carinicauda]|uniref:uncharacterized protein n=1 Tax=Palaemon carinicauda TaxID=392227 RepID=UPI0035B6A59A